MTLSFARNSFSSFANASGFLQELLASFETEAETGQRARLLLSAAVGGGKVVIDGGYEVEEIAK